MNRYACRGGSAGSRLLAACPGTDGMRSAPDRSMGGCGSERPWRSMGADQQPADMRIWHCRVRVACVCTCHTGLSDGPTGKERR